ncbi:uncharacterized protein [Aristolochia californica]|uniref:uncharacterized protein n=1 Tax=Aristolochia californica TaxID=171875 RepID=UPI0035DEAE31
MEIRSEDEENQPRKWSNNNVIVTVYVQPPTSCWRTTVTDRNGTDRKKFDWKPEKSRPGCNRKEQLLAYSQQLRSSGLNENQKTGGRWRLKSKKEKRYRSSGLKPCGWFQHLVFPVRRRWRYEKIECEEEKKSSKSNWKRRLKKKLKLLSWTWRCNRA